MRTFEIIAKEKIPAVEEVLTEKERFLIQFKELRPELAIKIKCMSWADKREMLM